MTSPFSPWVRRFWRRHYIAVEFGGATLLGAAILVLGHIGWWP